MGLQLVSGERLVKEFASSFSLWDVLSHWDSAQERFGVVQTCNVKMKYYNIM